MGIKEAWAGLVGKRQTSPHLFHMANLAARDRHVTRRSINPSVADILSVYGGYVQICARLNATMAASHPMRLYRPAKGTEKGKRLGSKRWVYQGAYGGGFDGKRVSRLEEKHLKNRLRGKTARYATMADEVEEVLDHPLLDLLDNPNEDDSNGFYFWQRFHQFGEPVGSEFLHVVMHERQNVPAELFHMEPHRVTVVPATDGERRIEHYWYGRDGSAVQRFETDEVLHYKVGTRLDDPYYGEGWISGLQDIQMLWFEMVSYMRHMMNNQGTPPAHFKVPEGMSKEEFDAAVANIERTFSGLANTGKPFVSTSEDVTILAHTPRDMEYIGGLDKVEQTVSAAAGVPESLLRMNDANLASAKEGHPGYLRRTIEPMLRGRAEFINEQIIPLYGLEPGELWVDYDELVAEDEEARARTLVSLVGGGIATANEARAEIGMEPAEDEGADQLRVNGQSLEALDAGPADPFAGLIPRALERELESKSSSLELESRDNGGQTPSGDTETAIGELEPHGSCSSDCGCSSSSGKTISAAKSWERYMVTADD